MRIVGSDKNLTEVSVNDSGAVKRNKDGTFHVPEQIGKALVKSGDFAVAGITFANARSWRCQDCQHNSLFKGQCGKCNGTNLVEEENN
jgi:hypothetical protein